MPTINETVATGADDGIQITIAGANLLNYYSITYVEAGRFGSANANLIGAVRFQTIAIPQGVTINSATLTFIQYPTTTGSPVAKIYGNNVDNAGAWGVANRVKNISKTSHSTNLDVASATSSNDVTAIIQDIVNRAGWVSNNNMAFGLFPQNTGSSANVWAGYAYEAGAGKIPALSITYTAGAGYVFDALLLAGD